MFPEYDPTKRFKKGRENFNFNYGQITIIVEYVGDKLLFILAKTGEEDYKIAITPKGSIGKRLKLVQFEDKNKAIDSLFPLMKEWRIRDIVNQEK